MVAGSNSGTGGDGRETTAVPRCCFTPCTRRNSSWSPELGAGSSSSEIGAGRVADVQPKPRKELSQRSPLAVVLDKNGGGGRLENSPERRFDVLVTGRSEESPAIGDLSHNRRCCSSPRLLLCGLACSEEEWRLHDSSEMEQGRRWSPD